MSSLVKNQIAKQLARFTKNFSPNKISVKFLKGEGELHNLELDEKILSDLLELPPWLRITKAVCNKISAKIHWTKLKTDPICLYLDCVEIDMEEVILTQAKQSSSAPLRPPPPQIKEKPANRYGFVEKVVDGMFVQMNSVVVSFKSMEFQASVQMSRLIVQSTTPDWKPDDLRNTRLKDEAKGEVLTFKDIHWSTLRIDANAIMKEKSTQKSSSPIRLITSHSSLHMTIKKKLEDCSVVSACLELLLDDILWVLTQSQLQALVGFMDSINKAVGQVSTKKEPVADGTPEGPQHQTYSSSNLQSGTQNDISGSEFSKYDLLETSYHLRTGRIDLHLCDDNDNDQTDDAHNLAGGAMQVHINKLAIDNYPYHLAGTSRTKWACHNEASLTRAYWVNQLLNTFRNNIKSRKVPGEGMSPRPTRNKTEGTSSVNGPSHPPASPSRHPIPPTTPITPHRATPTSPQHQRIGQPQNQRRPVFMYENCYLFRCEEFAIMPVTTNNAPNGGLPFLSSDKKALYLPTDMPAFQVDYTQYYYPTGVYSPVPCPNLFVQLNPVQLTLDTTTCIWFNRFLRSIFNSGEATCGLQTQQPTNPSHVDIRIEALMPKVILPCPSDPCCHYRESRPQALQIQMSQVALTNSRVGSNSSQTELLMLLQQFSSSKLYTDLNVFPNDANDVRPLSNLAWLKDFGVVEDPIRIERLLNGLHTEPTGHCRPSQVWCMTADQCWADFLGMTSNKNRPMPFVEALPLRLWFCTPLPSNTPETNQPISARHLSRVDARKDSLDSLNSSSAASSPGCQRAHPKTPHLSAPHALNSSPNSKHGTARTNAVISPLDIFQSNECTTKGLGSSLPDSSLLSASPRSRVEVESKRGLLESDGLMSSPSSSQISSSSSQEDAGDPLQATLATVNTNIAGLNHTSNGDVDHAKTVDALKGPEVDKSLRVPNRAPGSPELLSNGGSKRRSDTSPTGIRKDFGSYSSTDEENLSDYPGTSAKVADMSVLAIIPANFVAQFDHFQFLFLLRLQELLVKMQEDLAAERLKYLDDSDSTSGISTASVSFSVLAKRGEVSIVLPPSPDPWSRGTSSASSYLDPGFVSDGDPGPPDVASDNLDSKEKPPVTITDAIVLPTKDEQNVSPLNLLAKSPRADLLPVADITSASGVDPTGRGSASSMCESTDGWLPQDGEKGMSKTRRGSDGSCASSQLGTSVESSARSSARSVRSGRLVSIFTAEGNDIHLGIQMEGDDAAVKLTVQDLKVDEKGNLNFEKYLNQKSFKSPLDSSTTVPHPLPTSLPMVNVRAEFGPGAERNTPSAGERGFAHVQLNNIALSLLMSNIESLSECFEDEIILPKMPFYLELKTSNVCIRDDKPPRLLSVPPSLPLNVNLENISVFRNHDAAITIRALNPTPDLRGTYGCTTEDGVPFRGEFPRSVSRQLSRTTSDLSLAGSVSSKSDNDSERECMKAQLSVSRAALLAVQDERQALLKTIERLQYELSMSNREQDRLQSKVISYQSGGYLQKRKTHQ